MANLRQMIDGAATNNMKGGDDVFQHLKDAADKQNEYNTAKLKLHTKLAPARTLLKGIDQMHPQPDPTDPFQNPFMQTGEGGPGGMGQGLEDQDDLARTGQMARPNTGSTIDNYMQKTQGQQPGKQGNNGNNKLQTPDNRLSQGKAQQRSTSGNQPPKKAAGGTNKENKTSSSKSSKKVKVEITNDDMAGGGPGSGRRANWDAKAKMGSDKAREYGWKHEGAISSALTSRYSHPDYEGHTLEINTRNGSWNHDAGGGKGDIAEGHTASGLGKHLGEFHGKDSMAADYHDDAGTSMPSVAHGLAARRMKAGGPGSGRKAGDDQSELQRLHDSGVTHQPINLGNKPPYDPYPQEKYGSKSGIFSKGKTSKTSKTKKMSATSVKRSIHAGKIALRQGRGLPIQELLHGPMIATK